MPHAALPVAVLCGCCRVLRPACSVPCPRSQTTALIATCLHSSAGSQLLLRCRCCAGPKWLIFQIADTRLSGGC